MAPTFVGMFCLGAAGAGALELLKVYEIRGKIASKKYQKLIRSKLFWAVTVGMLVSSGFISWAFNADREKVSPWQVILVGVAARSLIRQPIATGVANKSLEMGASDNEGVSRDMFL